MINNVEARRMAYESIMNNAKPNEKGRRNAVIPFELLTVDPAYQRIEGRSERKLNKLRNEWEYEMMDALTVFAHPEECMFYVVNGLGRLIIAKEKEEKKAVDCVIILGPDDPEERRRKEARFFLRQGDCTERIKPVHKHRAKVITKDEVAIIIRDVCKEYKVKIVETSGRRNMKELGSYPAAEEVTKKVGEDGLRWVFDVIKEAGYSQVSDGYAENIMRALGRIYDGFGNVNPKMLGKYMRYMDPAVLKRKAIAKYPERYANNGMIAITLFLQDYIIENYNNMPAVFDERGKKVVELKSA